MEIEIQLTNLPIAGKIFPPAGGVAGAWLEFRGIVRGEESGRQIVALQYEAYPKMAEREIRRLLEALAAKHPCLAARVIHRVGDIPVGETAIYIGVAGRHRGEAFALLAEFMDRLKRDVPIWKRRALPAPLPAPHLASQPVPAKARTQKLQRSLNEAMTEISQLCKPLPPIRVPLADSFGRVLRETVCAPEDMPANDRSTRDGYAILAGDPAERFHIVDAIHAADWKPRQLQPGETVRVATGAALPCAGVRVVMQENVERTGDQICIRKSEAGANLRQRGEDVQAGQPLLPPGERLVAGRLALLAAAGCAQPLVSPRLRVAHFTTGDEIIPPDQIPKPGQIRDSNSILLRCLLQRFSCDLEQAHLPENFEQAQAAISAFRLPPSAFDLVLVSGGASVGDQDFTQPLLEWLGFAIVFSQVSVRPGRPLIFGTAGNRVAFGLPGNPLSHFVCFHFAIATALAKLTGQNPPGFLRGRLAAAVHDAACPRETLWPAQLSSAGLLPLPWASSGDVTCFATANALIRVPADCASLVAGAEVDFLPAGDMLGA